MNLSPFGKLYKDFDYWSDLYIKELVSKNSSNNTIKSYKNILMDFREFCFVENANDENLQLSDINRYFLHSYISTLKERKLSSSTINLYIKVLKSFFRYITENNDENVDLLKIFDKLYIKEPKREIVTFSKDEYDRIKSRLMEFMDRSSNYNKYKNYLALFVMALTGIRADEALNLKRSDIEDDGDYYKIRIFGKGSKERFVYILKDNIEEYLAKLDELKTKSGIKSVYLFPSPDGEKLSYVALYRFNSRFLEKIGIFDKKKHGLHTYRHTLGEILVEKNINLHTIKEWYGHSSIAVTSQYYAKTNERAKKSVSDALHA